MENIRVIFVLPKNCKETKDVSDVMIQAYESCRQNSVNVSWVKDCDFDTTDLTKTDFVVFQEFEGENFQALKSSKCAILGPWCVLVCLMKGLPIPNYPWPIYNVAMSGCVVACSHIPKSKKMEIKEKVQLMGGCYSDNLISTNTHLVAESVKSEKYLHAGQIGLALMVSKWVDAVWEASQNNNIHCDDQQFSQYKCLPFYNLTISSTGLPSVEMRNEVAQIVTKHGGKFTTNLATSTTDVLIVHGQNGILSKKYLAAKAHPNIYCVKVDWIYDSVEKGYALAHSSYEVRSKGTSTPTKETEVEPDFSMLSAIGGTTSRQVTTFEDSLMPKKPDPLRLFNREISPNKRKAPVLDIEKIVDGLDIKKAKRAGQYLDGCSVYLAGFKPDQREKLTKVLNLSGATRYDDISERLTHIIVGDPTCPEVKIVKSRNYSVALVSLQWLLVSMEKQQAEDEENYLINLHDAGSSQFNSPLGRKGLSLLRTDKTLTSIDLEANNSQKSPLGIDENLMEQYRKTATKSDELDSVGHLVSNFSDWDNSERKSAETTQNSEATYAAKKFLLFGLASEQADLLKEAIDGALGTVVPKTYKGIPDYLITPVILPTPVQLPAIEVVNSLWVTESVQETEEVAIAYYHRPLVLSGGRPLADCVVTTSGFSMFEKQFLKEIVEGLGGVSQDQFARVSRPEKNIRASTHLVCIKAEGSKYVAALKWALPVVGKEWLLESAKSGRMEAEDGFLMGDSKVSSKSTITIETSRNRITGLAVDKTSTPGPTTPTTKNILTPQNNKQPLEITKTVPSKSSITFDMTSDQTKVSTPTSSTNKRSTLGLSAATSAKNTPGPSTPVSRNILTPQNKQVEVPDKTPKRVGGGYESPCTQFTPINKLMEEVRRTNLLGTPETPQMPKTWYDVDTPESPFGAFIRPHLSPKSKKELQRYINQFPDFVPPKERRKSTPLAEVKKRFWDKMAQKYGVEDEQNETSTKNQSQEDESVERIQENVSEVVDEKLLKFKDMVTVMGEESRRASAAFATTTSAEEVATLATKETQPFSVGWDYADEIKSEAPNRIFIISGVETEQRQSIVDKLESLGAQVSELLNYDPNCTHMICPKPARNEKTLCCMAAGKWILHVSYVERCLEAGKFLPEEEFEFGNPKSRANITYNKENEHKFQSIYWWRREISKRGYGAFSDMRAIVVAKKKEPIVRVIEAGGGQIVDAEPPFDDTVRATHCLLEVKSVPDLSLYVPLAQNGTFCINTLYISDFLYRTNNGIKEAIVPQFSRFY